jgi:hypothetical protein
MKNEKTQAVLHGITRNHGPPSDTTFQIVGNLNKKTTENWCDSDLAPPFLH